MSRRARLALEGDGETALAWPAVELAKPRSMGSKQRRSRRLFLVEDDAWIRTFLRDVLSDEGYLVSEAADGRTALRMIQERPPDLLLLDLAMPEITGQDVLHELKRSRKTRHLPVLIISAYARVLPAAETDSVSGVLPKPLVVATLLEEVRRALGNERPNESVSS